MTGRAAPVRLAAFCLALAAFSTPASPEDGAVPKTQRVESADGRVGIELPGDWTIDRQKSDDSLVYLLARAPHDAFAVYVDVALLQGFRDGRAQAYADRRALAARYGADAKFEVSSDPVPHLVVNAPRPGKLAVHVSAYRVLARNGFVVGFHCTEKTWPVVKDACLRAAQSLTSTMNEWPSRPAGYRSSERDGYEYVVHPGVKDADLAALHQTVLDQEKRYARRHGPVPKAPDARPIVFVGVDRRAVKTDAGLGLGSFAALTEMLEGRVLTTPLRKDDVAARADLADALVMLFHAQRHGMAGSPWLCNGERLLARAEAACGKELPSLPADFLARLPKTPVTFEELVGKPNSQRFDEDAVYVALFRAGPQEIRDAFSAYLKDLAETGDWEAAEAKHLLSLDQEKLRAAAQLFLRSGAVPVKSK